MLGPTTMEREQGNGAAMEYSSAAMASCCRRAWLKEENSKGERENAEEGRDSGVHFVSSAHAHARGELPGMQAARAPRDLQCLCTESAELQFTMKIAIPPQKCTEISIFVPS